MWSAGHCSNYVCNNNLLDIIFFCVSWIPSAVLILNRASQQQRVRQWCERKEGSLRVACMPICLSWLIGLTLCVCIGCAVLGEGQDQRCGSPSHAAGEGAVARRPALPGPAFQTAAGQPTLRHHFTLRHHTSTDG